MFINDIKFVLIKHLNLAIMFKTKLLLLILLCSTFMHANTDKYRLMLRGNPSTSIVVGWNQVSGSNPIIYYGTTDYGTDYAKYSNSQKPNRTSSFKGMNNQFARLTNLTPNTAYYFVIKDNRNTSKRFWFKTAPADNSRLSFIAGGDSRNNRTPRRNANILVSKLKPHAVFFGGDMTDGDTDRQWKIWFDDWQLTIASDGRMFPIVATRGNHEDSNNSIYNLFDTPSSNIYYAITFGNNLLRTYTLNTEISISGNQTNWLKNDLASNSNIIWKMAQYHKPMRPHTRFKVEGNNQYNNWAKLFYDNNVRLVIECDAHMVKTTWPVKPTFGSGNAEGFIRDNDKGTVYAGEGCWGAPLRRNDDDKDWTRNSGRFNQFKWIFVDANKIEVRTIKVDNALEVGSVTNNNVFRIPSKLDIWSPSNGSVVTINKTSDGDNSDNSKIIEVAIASGKDDVEEDKNGELYVNSSDLELVYDTFNKTSYQKIGLRFTNISLPKNAVIENAYLQFNADEDNSDGAELEIALHNSVNSPGFSNENNVSKRAVFTNKVIWKPGEWKANQNSKIQRTPNLKNMVQALANKSSWRPGNSLSFIIRGRGKSLIDKNAKRVADSFEGGADKAPRLSIEYSIENTPPSAINICDNISEWNSNQSYSTGDKVVYQNNLFERTASEWEFLGSCGGKAAKSLVITQSIDYPVLDQVNIYPNPFGEQLTIDLGNRSGSFNVIIYDFIGKEIITSKIENSTILLNMSSLSSGNYFLKIFDSSGNLIHINKLIKK